METVTLVGYLAALFDDKLHAAGMEDHQNQGHEQHLRANVCGNRPRFSLWLAFGVMKGEWPITITNAVCLVLSAFYPSDDHYPARAEGSDCLCAIQRSPRQLRRLRVMTASVDQVCLR